MESSNTNLNTTITVNNAIPQELPETVYLLYGHSPDWGGEHVLLDIFTTREIAESYARRLIEMGLLPDDEDAWNVEARAVRRGWWIANTRAA